MLRRKTIPLLLTTLLWGTFPWVASAIEGSRVVSEESIPGVGPRHTIVTLETRPQVTLRLLLIQPPRPKAAAILFLGGAGAVGIYPMRLENGGGLLAQGREAFAQEGLIVALPDLPSDQDGPFGLTGFRTSADHAQDAAAIVHLLRERAHVPVWAVGASRGSVSAANAGARLAGSDRPDGVVLISSLLVPAGAADSDVLFNLPLEQLRGPVLIVHHEQDACSSTPFGELPRLVRALAHASPLDVKTFTGGGPPAGPPCTARHHHGFVGQVPEVTHAVAAWILTHGRRRAAHLDADTFSSRQGDGDAAK